MLPDAELERLRYAADFSLLPRAHDLPLVSGIIRHTPADFEVVEQLSFAPSGEGEHLYLRVRKTGQNTRWVGKRLADTAGLPYGAVGYAGLKDRHAVTEQWFSLHLPGQADPDLTVPEGVEILDAVRHTAKLRTGQIAANQFRVVIRELDTDPARLDSGVARLAEHGVPNYFGAQRFGRGARNLELLNQPGRPNREVRGFGLSALRGGLFNGYLAMRIVQHSWDATVAGEVPARDGGASGLMWGTGENRSSDRALELEQAWFGLFPETMALLEQQRVRMMRRALALKPVQLVCEPCEGGVALRFELPRGAFATVLLRELGEFRDASAAPPPEDDNAGPD
jgi:tRNA pseudouridine13 synthase